MLKRQKDFFKRLEEFEKTQYWSKAELEAYQEEKLQKLIRHAYETVPFYKELFNKEKLKPDDIKKIKDLQKLPILEKETLRSNQKQLLSRYVTNETISFRQTSGATGVPLSIANNYNASIIEGALFYRYLRWMGYNWGDKILKFWGGHVIDSPISRFKKMISRIIYNETFYDTYKVNDELLSKLALKIKDCPPPILRGYTSSIYLLALKCLELGIIIRLNAVSPTAEKLYRFQRDKMEEAFGKNIFDQYGCGETNSIAFECEKHMGLHVASEHVVLEIIDGDGQRESQGRVIITNLDDYAMPIIRYENGDMASWSNERCSCGRNLPLLKEIEGRIYDFIKGPNGKDVHTGFFDGILNEMNVDKKYSIKEFRVVQERIDKIRIEFVTEDNLNKRDEKIIKDKINEYVGEMEIEIRKVKEIPMTKMGKKMFVVSMLNRDKWEL